MALRILTGIIAIKVPTGRAIIGFNPHRLISADSTTTSLSETTTIGRNAQFEAVPAKLVALRQLGIQTFNVNAIVGLADDFSEHLRVNDEVNRDQLTISWNASVDVTKPFIRILAEEISYMVIGTVPD